MTQFSSPAWLTNPHIQTLLPRLIRRQPLFTPFWQRVDTHDGDFIDLAWSEYWQDPNAAHKPIFVLFHGLEGHFNSPYANGIMHAFKQAGWLCVMMHFRGCSGEPNRYARSYHSGHTEDARQVVELLEQHFPHQAKVALGVSLGGNMLANYLAQYRDDPKLNAATIVSAPFDLAACSQRIEQGFSKVYCRYLLNSLKRNALLKADLIEQQLGLNAQAIRAIKRLFEFDDQLTAPLNGFDSAQDYYRQCSALHRLNDIAIPTQIIHAKDDPFMTDAVIPRFVLSPHIDYQLLPHGGHVGFLTGTRWKPNFWLEEALPSYYQPLCQPNLST